MYTIEQPKELFHTSNIPLSDISHISIEDVEETAEDKAQHLRYALRHAMEVDHADVLLLSGGIDSGFLAALAPETSAITVVLEGQGVDTVYAQKITDYFHIPWHLVEISREEAFRDLHEIIRLLYSWDIGMLNDIPIEEGLKYAASLGMRTVRTGDAADTLFAGYTYLQEEGFDLKSYLRSLIPQLSLSSSRIGAAMGIRMAYPYLYGEVLDIAQNLELKDNVALIQTDRVGDFHTREHTGDTQAWGKIVLRNAAYGIIPEHLIWRTKTDLEYGSGMFTLEHLLAASLTPEEEAFLRKTGKHFWNKAHGKLYLIAQEAGIRAKEPSAGEYECQWCGGGVIEERHHCSTCGAWPADIKPEAVFKDEEVQ